jgi:hypothetical protein
MFKKLLQLFRVPPAVEQEPPVEVLSVPEELPTLKSTRGRKPRVDADEAPTKTPRKRKPKSE